MATNSAICAHPCYGPPWANWVGPLGKRAEELFREKLNQIMVERGVKNVALARAISVDPTTVTAWRKGKASPELARLTPICDFFGVDLSYFFPTPRGAAIAAELQREADDLAERSRAHNEKVQRLLRST